MPSGLQTLKLRDSNHGSVNSMTLPSTLESLTFGWFSGHNLEQLSIPLPSALQRLTLGGWFNDDSLERVTLPEIRPSIRAWNMLRCQ